MSLEDRDIFAAIWSRYTDQPVEFIMEQYEKAKRINLEIEKRLAPLMLTEGGSDPVAVETIEAEIVEPEKPVQQKKYTRRNLKKKPGEAIMDDSIVCCICGLERQSLTQKHLAAHGITAAEYRKLCGYDPKQPLMSRNRLAKSQEIIAKAQKARLEKRGQAGA